MIRKDIIMDLVAWIEGNLNYSLHLDDIANKCGYSKWHLQRVFKTVTGYNLSSYIRARRLSSSAIDLRSTDQPILHISIKYGFYSQQTFSRAFRKMFGVSPGQYRNLDFYDNSKLLKPVSISTSDVST